MSQASFINISIHCNFVKIKHLFFKPIQMRRSSNNVVQPIMMEQIMFVMEIT